MVSKELVLELQVIIKEEYNEELTYEETKLIALALVSYFSNVKDAYLACKRKKL